MRRGRPVSKKTWKLVLAVTRLRIGEMTFAEIGARLKISRQYAHQLFNAEIPL